MTEENVNNPSEEVSQELSTDELKDVAGGFDIAKNKASFKRRKSVDSLAPYDSKVDTNQRSSLAQTAEGGLKS